jgi:hypothetical protein
MSSINSRRRVLQFGIAGLGAGLLSSCDGASDASSKLGEEDLQARWLAALTTAIGVPIHFAATNPDALSLVKRMVLTRGNVLHPELKEALLETVAANADLSLLPSGLYPKLQLEVESNQVVHATDGAITTCSEIASVPPSIKTNGEWIPASKFKVASASNANSFGGEGKLNVPDDFHIPTTLATKSNVKHYGLSLVPNRDIFEFRSPVSQVMVTYRYKRDYINDFVVQPNGGGGVFVETHLFPHLHVPVDTSDSGYMIIGKRHSSDEFEFTAFEIPYGFGLYTPGGTIHGDSYLLGDFAMSLGLATSDTVTIFKRGEIQRDVITRA